MQYGPSFFYAWNMWRKKEMRIAQWPLYQIFADVIDAECRWCGNELWPYQIDARAPCPFRSTRKAGFRILRSWYDPSHLDISTPASFCAESGRCEFSNKPAITCF